MKRNVPRLKSVLVVSFIIALAMIVTGVFVGTIQAQYSGKGNHVVTLDQALKYIKNFKDAPSAPTTKGGYFERNIFDQILAQNGCVGIRCYYAKMDDGAPTLVLVGVDKDGNDLENGTIGEAIFPCPPLCPSSGQLGK